MNILFLSSLFFSGKQQLPLFQLNFQISTLLPVMLILLFSVSTQGQNEAPKLPDFPYDLNHPNEKYILPLELEEISGHTLLNDEIMICIQDEEGDLFFYDMTEKRIIKRVTFAKDADYEDIVRVNNVVYVLRSNGTLYKLSHFEDEDEIRTTEIKTRLSKKNNCEGICHDPVENRLLIALKGDPEANEEQNFKGYKAIYGFNIEKQKLTKKPKYLIELKQIKDLENASLYVRISHQIAESFEESDDIRFQPSALAIHPITDEIYVLASVGKAIVVMNRNGDLIRIVGLDKWRFVQPEAISFAPDGTMYISSEGDGGNGTLMKFNMKR